MPINLGLGLIFGHEGKAISSPASVVRGCLNLAGKNRGINDAHHWHDQRKRLRSLYGILWGESMKFHVDSDALIRGSFH